MMFFNDLTVNVRDGENDDKILMLMEKYAQKYTYKAKELFSVPGDSMDYVYYIASGKSRHYIYNVDGSIKILYFLDKGCFFGEAPCYLNEVTGLYSQAETNLVAYKLHGDVCRKLIDENPVFRSRLIECMSLKIISLRYEVENLTFNTCKYRLQRLFCSSVDEDSASDGEWCDMKIHYSHAILGEIVGATRVTVSRLINELMNDNFLRTINRKIQVNKRACEEFFNNHEY